MNKLKQLIKNKPVISIKQAFDYFKQETDIHIYNCANYKKYDYDSTKKPVIIEASTFPDPIAPCDLKFQIRVRDFKDSVSKLKNYEDWTFVKNKFERPYGPGIETELLIYLLEHLGFSEAITVGWDNKIVGDTSQNQHFYSGDEKEKPLINDCSLVPFEKLKLEEQISLDAISDWYDWLTGKGCRKNYYYFQWYSCHLLKCRKNYYYFR